MSNRNKNKYNQWFLGDSFDLIMNMTPKMIESPPIKHIIFTD